MVKVPVDINDEQAHQNATVNGGLRGGAIGLSASMLASVAAQRLPQFRNYQRLPLQLKAFGITAATTAAFIISADSAGRKFELAKYTNGGELENEAFKAQRLEEKLGLDGEQTTLERKLSTRDALVEYGKANRYSVVFGAWATSMVGSFAYISTTPLSFAQKLVQARMVAQGLTVLVLIASAGLSSIPTENGGENDNEIKQHLREDANFKWNKNSPHYLAAHAHDGEKKGVEKKTGA